MATDSASTTPTNHPQEQAPAARRPLWQVPVFLLGVATLAAMWLGRPLLTSSVGQRIDRDLKQAEQLLSRSDGDVEQALRLARRAFDTAVDKAPERSAEAALLVGTAYIRLAEKTTGPAAKENWEKAREALEQASLMEESIPESERPKLTYRLAKVGFYTGDINDRVIEGLEKTVDNPAVNRAEGYLLLEQAYQRRTPPDLARALEANRKLRDEIEASGEELSAAKLRGGELLLRLGKPEEARQSLRKIDKDAPPAILVRGQLLEARSYQDEEKWSDAAGLYTKALANVQVQLPQPAQIYYNLGLCYRKINQPQEAAEAWQKCADLARGEEGPAAAIVLADLRLLEPAPEKAVEALARAVDKVNGPQGWTNPLVDLARAREVFERAISSLRGGGRHDLACKALESYARLATPRRYLELKGEVHGDWARLRKQKAATDKPDPVAEKETRELFHQAAKALADAADLPDLPPAQQGDYLWASVPNHAAAEETDEVLRKLKRIVGLDLPQARLGEAWYMLGQEYRARGQQAEAGKAYLQCLRYGTRFEYLARYQLALADFAAGNLDGAESALLHNIRLLRFTPEEEALSLSQFALGNLLYHRRDYRQVPRHLEGALERARKRKDQGQEVTRAWFQLADSYRQLAHQQNQSFLLGGNLADETRQLYQSEHHRWLEKAALEFTALDEFLNSPAGADHLTREQREQIPFITAKCWRNRGQYEKALAIYERLVDQYKGKVLVLEALGGVVSCYAHMGDLDKVRQRLVQISQELEGMPADVRAAWEEWLKLATKKLKGL